MDYVRLEVPAHLGIYLHSHPLLSSSRRRLPRNTFFLSHTFLAYAFLSHMPSHVLAPLPFPIGLASCFFFLYFPVR